jgi:hypothetical protein
MSFVVDCGFLAEIQKMQEDVWVDPIQAIDKIPNVGIISTVMTNQDVNFVELNDKAKNRVINVEWQTACNLETEDCGDDCDINGDDLTPECKTYEIECLQEVSFKMPIRAYREKTIDFQKAMAINMLYAKKRLADWLDQYTLAGLLANAGVNQFTGGVGTVVAGTTYIPASYWDDNIWGYMAQVTEYNQFNSPYLLTGDNLFQKIWNKGIAGETRPFDWLRPVADPRAFNTLGINDQSILVHKTAAAFLNKAWNPVGSVNAEQRAGQYWEWSEPLTFTGQETRGVTGLTNVFVDVTMKEECINNEFYQAVKLKLWGLFALNPQPCDKDNTGIIVFECGTGV